MSVFKTTIIADLKNCRDCLGDCDECKMLEVEVEVECDATPYRPAKINCSADDSYPAEGGLSIEKVVRVDTGEDVTSEGVISCIESKVLDAYQDYLNDKGVE